MQLNSMNLDHCLVMELIHGEGKCVLDSMRNDWNSRHQTFNFRCSYSLTLIDALDTLAVMGNNTEFIRVTKLLTEKINFDSDINVSVFETNIRIVGGLLSAHLMSHR